jgi:hypothetical protein
MKKILLLSFFCLSLQNFAQTITTPTLTLNTYNKYLVKINPAVTINTINLSKFIGQICATDLVSYNTTTNYFEILTTKILEKNIIDGKLQKNATPMFDYIYTGEVKFTPSTNNEINAE